MTPRAPESHTRVATPGVVNRNDNVVKNIAIAPRLPAADNFGEKGLAPISNASVSSTTPKAREKFRISSNP